MAANEVSKPTGSVLKTSFKVENKIEAFYTGGRVQISSDGDHLFCTCGDRIQVLQNKTGRIYKTLNEDEDEITCFILAKDDEILISASRSGLLRQWNWKEEKVARKWKSLHNSPIISMAFDATSTLLATGSTDNTIKVWDILKQYCTHNFRGSQGIVQLVEFHPDANKLQLFSSAGDCKIRIWDLSTSKCISTLDGHFSPVTAITFVEDNQFMISTGRDKVVIFWDLSTRTSIKTIPVYEAMESLVVLPKAIDYEWCPKSNEAQRLFVTVGEKGLIKAWSFPAGKCVFTQKSQSLPIETEGDKSKEALTVMPIVQAMINESLSCLITISFDHNIILHDLASLKQTKQLVGHYDEILDLKFVGENDSMVAVASNSPQVKVIDRESMHCSILNGHSETVMALDASYDGKYIASCSKDNTVRVWKKEDDNVFRCVAIGAGHTHAVGAVSWPKNSTNYLASGSQDLTVKCWKVPQIFKEDSILKMSAHWTTKAHDKDINCVTYSPNDKFVATGSQDKMTKIFLASDGSLYGTLRGHKRGIWCIVFSPVDKCLATASADSTIKIWAIQDLTCVKTLEGHTNSVLKLQFITRGMQLVSSGSDGLIKIWNVKTNECTSTLDEHEDKIWSLAVDKSENCLVTGGGESVLNIWKDVTEEERREEEAKQDESILKQQELSNFLEQKKYIKAVALAITLDQPFRVLTIFKNLLDERDGRRQIEKIVENLRDDQIDSVLKLMCDWNTNAKHSNASQTVLSIIMQRKSPDDLMQLSNMKESVEALLPYTERHFNRLNRLLQQSAFLDYTWQSMKLAVIQDDTVPARPPDDVTSVEESITAPPSTAVSENDQVSEVKQQEEHKYVEEMECSDEQFTEEKENIASSNQENASKIESSALKKKSRKRRKNKSKLNSVEKSTSGKVCKTGD